MYKYRKPLEAHEIEKLQELSQLNFLTMNETDVSLPAKAMSQTLQQDLSRHHS